MEGSENTEKLLYPHANMEYSGDKNEQSLYPSDNKERLLYPQIELLDINGQPNDIQPELRSLAGSRRGSIASIHPPDAHIPIHHYNTNEPPKSRFQ